MRVLEQRVPRPIWLWHWEIQLTSSLVCMGVHTCAHTRTGDMRTGAPRQKRKKELFPNSPRLLPRCLAVGEGGPSSPPSHRPLVLMTPRVTKEEDIQSGVILGLGLGCCRSNSLSGF